MANFQSLSAAGTSIEQLLNAGFASVPAGTFTRSPKAALVRTEDLDPNKGTGVIKPGVLSIYFWRVESNKTMRAAWSSVGSFDGLAHLPLDLHFLITAWEENLETELQILGRAMQSLETSPILSGPQLAPAGAWTAGEAVQVVLEDVPPDSLFRIFDSLQTDFKLSVPYIARVIRIDSEISNLPPEVTTVAAGSVASVMQ